MRFNREIFFSRFRASFGKLSQSQVGGLTILLDKLEQDTFSLEQAAYVLATVKHETAHTFRPIKEKRGREGTRIRKIQDRYWHTGAYGRGYVQITWPENYLKFGLAPGFYDKALEPEKAYEILSLGMRKGMFTKYKLGDFVNGDVDYVNARKVVNGLDKASQLAEIAERFERILKASLIADETVETKPESKPAIPAPQITVEHAEEVNAEVSTPIPGGAKDDPPKQASQGGRKSTIATIVGGVTGVGAAIGGWLQNNSSLAMVGIVCATIVILTWMFRQLIIDYIRITVFSDPNKINVK